jgi:hypothetical protein
MIIKNKNIVKLFALAFLIGVGSGSAQKVGTSSYQFLKVMPTAKATAMGDAFASLAWGADAVFWNPAGLSSVNSQEFSSTMTLWIFETKQTAISYAHNIEGVGTFAAQFQYVDYGTIEETRVDHLQFVGSGDQMVYNPGLTGRTFSPKAWVLGLSYGASLTDHFSTGLTVKYVKESLFSDETVKIATTTGSETYNTNSNTFLFDFGMLYKTGFRSVQLGASVQNFGSQIKVAKEEYPAPLTFRLGVSGNLIGKDALLLLNESNRVTLSYDIIQPNDYAQQMHFGVEYSFSEQVALRAGYKNNYDNEKFTFGVGVNSNISGYNIGIDYSFAGMGEFLGNVHRISLGVKL